MKTGDEIEVIQSSWARLRNQRGVILGIDPVAADGPDRNIMVYLYHGIQGVDGGFLYCFTFRQECLQVLGPLDLLAEV